MADMTEERRVLIVEARFYEDIAGELAKGAARELKTAGVGHDRLTVPGVFEVPGAIRFAIRAMETHSATTNYAGFVALGTVIRGETDHYQHISREVTRALMDITIHQSVALGFGILTCDTHDQAKARAAVDRGNKGAEAVRACLRMMEVKKDFRLARR
ncbi:MAG: 6,7-dimethyl-8-ribityllumazine synthase [Proteobacteria bacterium]|nr:6,7-dimethyl-8-ribityllumazine synthase [Pseudomonadota bacterium]